jgi:hypothetical protein
MSTLKARFVSEVFKALVSKQSQKTDSEKLSNGAKLRNEMYDQIKRGETPTGYRAEWVKDSARKVVNLLAEIAADFNKRFPEDRCSANDFIDILSTVKAWIKKAAEKKKNG